MEKKKNNLTAFPAIYILIDWIYKNPTGYLLLCAKQTDITYSHLSKLKNLLVTEGVLFSEERGRQMSMVFTPKGKKIAEAIIYLRQLLEDKENVNNEENRN